MVQIEYCYGNVMKTFGVALFYGVLLCLRIKLLFAGGGNAAGYYDPTFLILILLLRDG